MRCRRVLGCLGLIPCDPGLEQGGGLQLQRAAGVLREHLEPARPPLQRLLQGQIQDRMSSPVVRTREYFSFFNQACVRIYRNTYLKAKRRLPATDYHVQIVLHLITYCTDFCTSIFSFIN